mmetsp:Transcript_22127/g.54756  ORF Transcript_22127/g.54756 Transcript_22127/m.54756 type:complete len:495 (+) Transcript_22127:149-1633(+)
MMAPPPKKETKRRKESGRIISIPAPVYAVLFLALGYYLGSQRQLSHLISHDDTPDLLSSSLDGFVPKKVGPSPSGNQVSNANKNATKNDHQYSSTFRLHPSIEISEDPELFKKLVYPGVRKFAEAGEVEGCPLAPVQPYIDILKNIEEDPLYYEDGHGKNNQTCPVVYLFYFEGGSKIADTFFDFYSNIKTKRCLNFIVSSRWIDQPGTKEMAASNGYTIVGKHFPKQDKTISSTLYEIQKQYGDDVLVSVNDLDHLLVWFDDSGKTHRYSSYTDMVRLYAYELLSTPGCSNQNVMEKYVVPCTCLMEENIKYISTAENGVIWSEYGTTNRFHPTGNFYLDRRMTRRDDGDSNYVYSIGTVFANLRKYEGDIITHHKICYKSKKVFSRAKMSGVIHARSDNMIQTLTKYQHFLFHSMQKNGFRSDQATVADAMGCSVVDTHDILKNERTCRKVKEFANILSIGHQKLACLNAGYSEEHCMNDFSCCLTYEKNPE